MASRAGLDGAGVVGDVGDNVKNFTSRGKVLANIRGWRIVAGRIRTSPWYKR